MYITTPKRKGGITVVRLMHGYRENGKLKQKVVKTIGQSRDPARIEYMKNAAKEMKRSIESGEKQNINFHAPIAMNLYNLKGKVSVNNGVPDILGSVYDRLGFDKIISDTRKDKEWNEILKYCVFSRLLEPSSKLRSIEVILDQFEKKISHDQVLKMMDHLSKREEKIKTYLSKKMIEESKTLDLMLFDVTTLYFENINVTDLKNFGFSKDSKFKEVQVVLALLTDSEGLPITYEVFPGNTAETKTFIHCMEDLKKKYKLNKIRVTADKAMFSKKNFSYFEDKEIHGNSSMEYIISCPLKKIAKKLQEEVLNLDNYTLIDEDRSAFEFLNDGRRVVAIHSRKRAELDRHRREKLLDMIKKLEGKNGEIAVEKLTRNRGVSRFLKKSKESVTVNKEAVIEDAQWDGIAGLCTNIKNASPRDLMYSYKRLWKIEESFRINKHTLKMRPIFHRLSKRIKSHIMICFLSYIILRYTEIFLKSRRFSFGPRSFLNTLSDIKTLIVQESKSKKQYAIPEEMSEEGQKIYKAFGVKRNEIARLLLDPIDLS